jgi:hypothetical protein
MAVSAVGAVAGSDTRNSSRAGAVVVVLLMVVVDFPGLLIPRDDPRGCAVVMVSVVRLIAGDDRRGRLMVMVLLVVVMLPLGPVSGNDVRSVGVDVGKVSRRCGSHQRE